MMAWMPVCDSASQPLYGPCRRGIFSQVRTLPQTSMIGNLKFDEDFNNDGLMELQRFSIDFGFGTLASMAMGGGDTDVDVEFSVHKQLADGTFSEEPNADFEVEMPLSMSNNSSLKPLLLADINGDGRLSTLFIKAAVKHCRSTMVMMIYSCH